LFLFFLAIHQYVKSYSKLDLDKHWVCKEFFNGIKDTKWAKLFTIMFLLVRFLSVVIIFLPEDVEEEYKLIGF